MTKKRWIFFTILLLIIAAPITFFAWFENFSRQLEAKQNFSDAQANAAKHAYAAANIQEVLRTAGFSADSAEIIVLELGEFNEYLETIFKISEPDSTREIMKDMFNNQAGILVAEWVRAHPGMNLRDTVIRLAENHILANSSYTIPHSGPEVYEDYPQSVRHASAWFCERQKTIKTSVNEGLADTTGKKAK